MEHIILYLKNETCSYHLNYSYTISFEIQLLQIAFFCGNKTEKTNEKNKKK